MVPFDGVPLPHRLDPASTIETPAILHVDITGLLTSPTRVIQLQREISWLVVL
jgi:hypothetical protein